MKTSVVAEIRGIQTTKTCPSLHFLLAFTLPPDKAHCVRSFPQFERKIIKHHNLTASGLKVQM